jgi:two-component sensor histidine kinase
MLKNLIDVVQENRTYQFWLLQLIGWGGFSIVTFLSLTLWYNTVEWPYVSHIFLQALLGMLLSLPLHRIYLVLWNRPVIWRLGLSIIATAIVAIAWTALRIVTFIWLTGEQNIWADFGGWYFASFMVFLCWSALYYGNKYYYKAQVEYQKGILSAAAIKEEQFRRLNAEADTRDAQIKMLRYQLNPHFLFNTLNAVSALVKFQETDKAHRMIVQLSHFLRYSLDSNPAARISLQQEIDALMMYLSIEQIRLGDRLKIEFDIDDDAKLAKVPSLLLQPLVENSIKYAIAPSEDGGTIRLLARVKNGKLRMELTDTGADSAGNEILPRKGRRVGLHNTLERLKTLYEDAYLFDISLRQAGGLRVSIRIPYDPVDEVLHPELQVSNSAMKA